MDKERLDNLVDLNGLGDLGHYSHVETIRIPKLSYLTKAKNLIRSLFNPIYSKANAELRTDDELIYTHSKGGYVAFSYTSRKNGAHRFEIYRLKDVGDRKNLEEPEFIRNIRKLLELEKRRGGEAKLSWTKKLKRPRFEKSSFKYGELRQLDEEASEPSCEQMLLNYKQIRRWCERLLVKMAYEAVDFRGYESKWDKIRRMLPTLHRISREKMEKWGGKDVKMIYCSLFGEVWSDKDLDYISYGKEVASHVLEDWRNHGCRVELNPLQEEAIEWIEDLADSHLSPIVGKEPFQTSLSKEKIKKIKMIMRLFDEDRHVGYWLANPELAEKVKNMSASERRKALSYEGYLNEVLKDAKQTPEERLYMLLHMFNQIVGTRSFSEQKRNVALVKALLKP